MLDIESFFREQLAAWETARRNVKALESVQVRTLVDPSTGELFRLQYNPARSGSTLAKVDAHSVAERPCFLCAKNRPPEQISIPWHNYEILVNPFPIFHRHLTIASSAHVPQLLLLSGLQDMLALAHEMPDFVVFYNGARCGASAPDHRHFQACKRESILPNGITRRATVFHGAIADVQKEAWNFIQKLPVNAHECEPMINVLAWIENNENFVAVFPRKKHRPDCYSQPLNSADLENLGIDSASLAADGTVKVSPASAEMAGVIVTARQQDFLCLTAPAITAILRSVAL